MWISLDILLFCTTQYTTDTKRNKTSTEKLTKGTIILNSLLHFNALQWLTFEMLSSNSNK